MVSLAFVWDILYGMVFDSLFIFMFFIRFTAILPLIQDEHQKVHCYFTSCDFKKDDLSRMVRFCENEIEKLINCMPRKFHNIARVKRFFETYEASQIANPNVSRSFIENGLLFQHTIQLENTKEQKYLDCFVTELMDAYQKKAAEVFKAEILNLLKRLDAEIKAHSHVQGLKCRCALETSPVQQ